MQPLITRLDERLLRSLLLTSFARRTPAIARRLADKLDQARVVEGRHIPACVATMNSRISCSSVAATEDREISLVYPWASAPEQDRYSIFSELGVDLLGTIPGRRIFIGDIPWDVLYIAYQPTQRASPFERTVELGERCA